MRRAVVMVAAVFFALVSAQASFAAILEPGSGGGGERTKSDVVGASISHPERWIVEREKHTYDDSYGFTLWRPQTDKASDDHGGVPAVRVSRAYDLEPGQIEAAVREKLAQYPDLPLIREEVSVAAEGHEGVAVGPIPGSTPAMEVYVPVDEQVYRIHIYSEGPGEVKLDADDRELLSSLRFYSPSKSVGALDVERANAPQTLYREGDEKLLEQEQTAREDEPARMMAASSSNVPVYRERRIYEGCYLASSTFFVQTQQGALANKRWGKSYTGKTIVGRPNFWGNYSHGSMGYGRCASTYYANDKFAVDYPLARGDSLYSPFRRGTVTFAGRSETHKAYGILVVIRAGNGKYVSLSAHLSGLAPGIKRGAKVNEDTLIGYAGATGGPRIPVGEPHLHQAFYRYPHFNPDGTPYGGRGLQVVYFHYSSGPGVYKFGWSSSGGQKTEGSWIRN